MIAADTDVGIEKDINQDSLTVKLLNSPCGKAVFAVLCDGIGGLSKGELASATVVRSYVDWFLNKFPKIYANGAEESVIINEWNEIVQEENVRIMRYGKSKNINLGTTALVAIFMRNKYIAMNVGDSRAYEICEDVKVLTQDQTIVAKEVENGKITPEQALIDPRRNVLLQCVGASYNLIPEFISGNMKKDAVYAICSDGFVHMISSNEIYDAFSPQKMSSVEAMKESARYLIELNKSRMESDNISVIVIKTF